MSLSNSDGRPAHRRRPRYRGTHPRRFDQRYKEHDPRRWPDLQTHVRSQGRTPAGTHVPVMLNEALAALRPRPGEIAADGTLGFGGHAVELLGRIMPGGRLVGFDVDCVELERASQRIRDVLAAEFPGEPEGAFVARRGSFAGIGHALAELGLDGYDLILADLGVSSMQIDDPARGFSYKHDGPLDMRMDQRIERTAADLLATLSEDELSAALKELADEPDHARIAHAIVRQRQRMPILRSRPLEQIVLRAKSGTADRATARGAPPARRRHRSAAAPTFQALRMLVNDEPGQLRQLLRMAPYSLRAGGRIVIISFHSGEDRLVREAFDAGRRGGAYADASPEAVHPTAAARRVNPRCASARLRWAVRA